MSLVQNQNRPFSEHIKDFVEDFRTAAGLAIFLVSMLMIWGFMIVFASVQGTIHLLQTLMSHREDDVYKTSHDWW